MPPTGPPCAASGDRNDFPTAGFYGLAVRVSDRAEGAPCLRIATHLERAAGGPGLGRHWRRQRPAPRTSLRLRTLPVPCGGRLAPALASLLRDRPRRDGGHHGGAAGQKRLRLDLSRRRAAGGDGT